jgi:shikimate dehydrogenase
MNINKDTKIYGSFSDNPGNNGCIFFNNEFEKHGINAIYKSFYSTDSAKLVESVKHLNFSGFALSMPLKVDIMNYLDEIDSAALEIGAVNTVINNDGKLTGYNTDWLGVKKYIEILPYCTDHITILGNGGFSKAVQYACKKLDINYTIITRKNWDELYNKDFWLSGTINLIFNATPIDIIVANLIDGRPFTETGKIIANFQAKEQFLIYTGIKIT